MAFARISKRLVAVLAVLVALAIGLGFLAARSPVADSLAHFRFHLSVAMALAVALMAAARAWRAAGLAAVVTVAGIAGLGPALPFRSTGQVDGVAPSMTLIQLNLSFRNRSPEAVADFIRREKADVVTLQEVTDGTARLLALLEGDYPHNVRCPFAAVGGVAVLSRLPRAPGRAEGCAPGQGLAWLRVTAGGRPVSVASVHLHWPYPFGQAPQIDLLQARLEDVPRPVVLAGDFNAAPWSQAVARIERASDTAVIGGLRFTFGLRPARWAPAIGMPIDHVLVPAGISPVDIRRGPGPGSDHRSVVARLALVPAVDAQGRADPPSGGLADGR